MSDKITADELTRIIEEAIEPAEELNTVRRLQQFEAKAVSKLGKETVAKVLEASGVPSPCYRVKDLARKRRVLTIAMEHAEPAKPAPVKLSIVPPAPALAKPPALPAKPAPEVHRTGFAAVRFAAAREYAAALDATSIPLHRAAPSSTHGVGVTRKQLESILAIAQPAAAGIPQSSSDEEARLEVEKVCYQAHLSFPQFMRPDAELTNEGYWRTSTPTGTGRYLRAEAKRQIEKILSK